MEPRDWSPNLVVVAADGSEGSIAAARLAATIARVHGAHLSILTVVRPPEGWWGIGGSPPTAQAMTHALTVAQEEVLDATAEAIDLTGLEWDTSVEIGDPASTVSGFCVDNSADLLVIGRRGAGLIERMVMGSTADRLAHEAPCPLLIVP